MLGRCTRVAELVHVLCYCVKATNISFGTEYNTAKNFITHKYCQIKHMGFFYFFRKSLDFSCFLSPFSHSKL